MPKFIYVGVLCFCEKLMNNEVVVCRIVDEFMIKCCCCCCYEMLLLMIDAMGIHNCEVVVGIKLFWKLYEKWIN